MNLKQIIIQTLFGTYLILQTTGCISPKQKGFIMPWEIQEKRKAAYTELYHESFDKARSALEEGKFEVAIKRINEVNEYYHLTGIYSDEVEKFRDSICAFVINKQIDSMETLFEKNKIWEMYWPHLEILRWDSECRNCSEDLKERMKHADKLIEKAYESRLKY